MLCKAEDRDPAHCLKEGRRVTRCAQDLYVWTVAIPTAPQNSHHILYYVSFNRHQILLDTYFNFQNIGKKHLSNKSQHRAYARELFEGVWYTLGMSWKEQSSEHDLGPGLGPRLCQSILLTFAPADLPSIKFRSMITVLRWSWSVMHHRNTMLVGNPSGLWTNVCSKSWYVRPLHSLLQSHHSSLSICLLFQPHLRFIATDPLTISSICYICIGSRQNHSRLAWRQDTNSSRRESDL